MQIHQLGRAYDLFRAGIAAVREPPDKILLCHALCGRDDLLAVEPERKQRGKRARQKIQAFLCLHAVEEKPAVKMPVRLELQRSHFRSFSGAAYHIAVAVRDHDPAAERPVDYLRCSCNIGAVEEAFEHVLLQLFHFIDGYVVVFVQPVEYSLDDICKAHVPRDQQYRQAAVLCQLCIGVTQLHRVRRQSEQEKAGVGFDQAFDEFGHQLFVLYIRRGDADDHFVFAYEIIERQIVDGNVLDRAFHRDLGGSEIFIPRDEIHPQKFLDSEHLHLPGGFTKRVRQACAPVTSLRIRMRQECRACKLLSIIYRYDTLFSYKMY